MPTGHDVIRKARSQIGVTEHPLGSNSGREVEEYQRATWLAGTGWPWCVAFCQWVFRELGVPLPNGGAGAWALLDWAKSVGWAVNDPRPGDICILSEGSGHACLFERFEGTDVVTVDGNWGDRVGEQRHSKAIVKGYVRNKHLEHPGAKVKARRPRLFQVATSHSGHRKVVFVAKKRRRVARWIAHHTLGRFPNGITITRGRKGA